jgi:hypothetical protein
VSFAVEKVQVLEPQRTRRYTKGIRILWHRPSAGSLSQARAKITSAAARNDVGSTKKMAQSERVIARNIFCCSLLDHQDEASGLVQVFILSIFEGEGPAVQPPRSFDD